MRYSELIESKMTESEIREFLKDGEMIAITFRIPKNLKESAAEAASLKGISFSAFIRMSMMDQLAKHPNE